MGRAVLTNQFLSGLQPELKSKLAGQEGSFDQLLARARFEEAKQREFAAERERRSSSRSEWQSSTKDPSQGLHTGSQGRGPLEGSTSWTPTNKRLTRGHLAISHQGKHEPDTMLHMWSNGACASELP